MNFLKVFEGLILGLFLVVWFVEDFLMVCCFLEYLIKTKYIVGLGLFL